MFALKLAILRAWESRPLGVGNLYSCMKFTEDHKNQMTLTMYEFKTFHMSHHLRTKYVQIFQRTCEQCRDSESGFGPSSKGGRVKNLCAISERLSVALGSYDYEAL